MLNNKRRSLQGLTETLYSKTQAASTRQRKEFVPKTLEDLGIETSCDLSLTAPHLERQMRGSGSSRYELKDTFQSEL